MLLDTGRLPSANSHHFLPLGSMGLLWLLLTRRPQAQAQTQFLEQRASQKCLYRPERGAGITPTQMRQAGSCAVCLRGCWSAAPLGGEPGSGIGENVGHGPLAKRGERRGSAGRRDEKWWCILCVCVTPSDPPFSARSFFDKEMWLDWERWGIPGH